MRGSSILAALFNAVFLLVTVGGLSWEAIRRLGSPEPVAGKTMMVVAAIGILVNAVTAWLFASGRKDDINLRGAFLHMASDALVSVGVVAAGLVILLTGWLWIDPVVSLVINAVIVWGTWGLLRDSIGMSMAAVPAQIDPAAVRTSLSARTGVVDVHDLHIWPMSTTENALTCHLVMPNGHLATRFFTSYAAISPSASRSITRPCKSRSIRTWPAHSRRTRWFRSPLNPSGHASAPLQREGRPLLRPAPEFPPRHCFDHRHAIGAVVKARDRGETLPPGLAEIAAFSTPISSSVSRQSAAKPGVTTATRLTPLAQARAGTARCRASAIRRGRSATERSCGGAPRSCPALHARAGSSSRNGDSRDRLCRKRPAECHDRRRAPFQVRSRDR